MICTVQWRRLCRVASVFGAIGFAAILSASCGGIAWAQGASPCDDQPWQAPAAAIEKGKNWKPKLIWTEAEVPTYTLPPILEDSENAVSSVGMEVATEGTENTEVEFGNSARVGTAVDEATSPERTDRWKTLRQFRQLIYGETPAIDWVTRVQAEVSSQPCFGGRASATSWRVQVSHRDQVFEFPAVCFEPRRQDRTKTQLEKADDAAGDDQANLSESPFPVVLFINNRFRPQLDGDGIGLVDEGDPASSEAETIKRREFFPVETFIERGYAVVSFFTSDVDPDDRDRTDEGVRGFVRAHFPESMESSSAPWGALDAWAWGADRLMDVIATQPTLDQERVAIAGHSRGGKTALWAAAKNRRYAIAYSNQSGCLGAALSKRCFGETVEEITRRFPHWFTERARSFADREAELPIDQHQLIGLIAPRAVFLNTAGEDLWSDPRGQYLAMVAARPAFEITAVPSVTDPSMPPLNCPKITGQTGFVIRPGGHGLTRADWNMFLKFADQIFDR